MKKERRKTTPFKSYFRNIAIMLVIALVSGTISVSANVSDNLGTSIDKILGPVNASLNGGFSTSSTNGKLNQMKKDMDATKTSVSDLLAPYLSSLTVWVDSTNASYNGRVITVTNNDGEMVKSAFSPKNGRYEATFPKLVRNQYNVAYPYILSNGQVINMSITTLLAAGDNTKQLFGELQQMSMKEIQTACKDGIINTIANVGDTVSDGTYTYTIIGINQDKPCDADGNLLDSDSYGDVITLMALGAPAGADDGKTPVTLDASKTPYGTTTAMMYSSNDTNNGSWKASEMRTTTMASYLAKLPASTQKVIGYVQKVTGQYNKSTTIATGDKCFLLSAKELYGGAGHGNGSFCTTAEASATFQYQYFENIATTYKDRDITGTYWWTRSPVYFTDYFCMVSESGNSYASPRNSYGVFPAFCIY